MYKIQIFDNISTVGLKEFPEQNYALSKEPAAPDVILVRSHNLKTFNFPSSIKAVGRAGIGTDNIPVDALTQQGIPVFYTPGANANAVKELVIAGLFLACRPIEASLNFVRTLEADNSEMKKIIEQQKNQFAGTELFGKTLGIVGLGNIGARVAEIALALGMEVIGFDPALNSGADSATLAAGIHKAANLEFVLKNADFITMHVPLIESTKHLINEARIGLMKQGAVLLNFSRQDVADNNAILHALNASKLHMYVSDFPDATLKAHPRAICLPHLGASTKEAEENCAIAIVKSVRDFLERGHITNSVNFPNAQLEYNGDTRIAVVNNNIPGVVESISHVFSSNGCNIAAMINKSRGGIAYNLIDLSDAIDPSLLNTLANIPGILKVYPVNMARQTSL